MPSAYTRPARPRSRRRRAVRALLGAVRRDLPRAGGAGGARVPPRPGVGIATAGVIPAATVAAILQADFEAMRISRRDGREQFGGRGCSRPRRCAAAASACCRRRITTKANAAPGARRRARGGPSDVRTATSFVRPGGYRPNYLPWIDSSSSTLGPPGGDRRRARHRPLLRRAGRGRRPEQRPSHARREAGRQKWSLRASTSLREAFCRESPRACQGPSDGSVAAGAGCRWRAHRLPLPGETMSTRRAAASPSRVRADRLGVYAPSSSAASRLSSAAGAGLVGITFDLLVTIPAAFYFMVVRRGSSLAHPGPRRDRERLGGRAGDSRPSTAIPARRALPDRARGALAGRLRRPARVAAPRPAPGRAATCRGRARGAREIGPIPRRRDAVAAGGAVLVRAPLLARAAGRRPARDGVHAAPERAASPGSWARCRSRA